MASVVIIHAAEDTLPARALAEKLRQAQLQVILEKQPGEDAHRREGADDRVCRRVRPQIASRRRVKFARGKQPFRTDEQRLSAKRSQRQGGEPTGWRGEQVAAWRELAKLVTIAASRRCRRLCRNRPQGFPPGRVAGRWPTAAASSPATTRTAAAAPATQRPRRRRALPPATATLDSRSWRRRAEEGRRHITAAVVIVHRALGGGGYWFMTQSNASATSSAWDSVSRDDADALRAFIDGDPGEYRGEAETALANLEERRFEAAGNAGTIEAYEAFLNDFPNSEHATRANGRIAELRLQQPATETPTEEVPLGPETDPDLLPPGTTTTRTPDTTGGPQQITPAEEPTPPPADLPTN
jgi:hypothetical protein